MIIAVASGKGGTGKTTVSASLASIWEEPLIAVDLDVEEPNLHLFLTPQIQGRREAHMEVPVADESLCTRCGACSELCQFKAISLLGEVLLAFPEMCHGCGGCLAVCPAGALTPGVRELGEISWGRAGDARFLMGRLRVGEAMSPPLMRQVKDQLNQMLAQTPADVIIDCPPGVSCPAVNSVMDSDLVLLVTEPTPFGFYDFELAWRAFSDLGKPMAAIINRAGVGDRAVYDFCAAQGLPILGEIPFARAAAEAYSKGQVLAQATPELNQAFRAIAGRVRELAAGAAAKEAAHA
ncbi:(4Fe-4S)-binding protein [Desulfocarbo indianensis]|nr:(4Fe-4S)-binding protein [Desulfocarbo indianensis]